MIKEKDIVNIVLKTGISIQGTVKSWSNIFAEILSQDSKSVFVIFNPLTEISFVQIKQIDDKVENKELNSTKELNLQKTRSDIKEELINQFNKTRKEILNPNDSERNKTLAELKTSLNKIEKEELLEKMKSSKKSIPGAIVSYSYPGKVAPKDIINKTRK